MSDKIMTDLKELKQNVLMTAKKAYDEKLMAGTSGNISAYFREKQWIVITPSSYDYSLMAEEDIVVIDLDGNLVEGRHKPSSEWKMHAEIYRHLHAEIALVHDLCGNILPEAVDDAVHEEIFTEQSDLAFFAVEHGELLRKIRRDIKILRLLYSGFLRDLQAVDAVYPELCDLLPVVVEAHEIVYIVVPEQGIRGNGVELPVMPVDALL